MSTPATTTTPTTPPPPTTTSSTSPFPPGLMDEVLALLPRGVRIAMILKWALKFATEKEKYLSDYGLVELIRSITTLDFSDYLSINKQIDLCRFVTSLHNGKTIDRGWDYPLEFLHFLSTSPSPHPLLTSTFPTPQLVGLLLHL